MRYRTMGKLGWQVSEIGYGMWGIAGGPGGFASGADYELAPRCLDEAIALGCNFFDTAWAYGRGISELLLGATLRRHRAEKLYVGTKVPPKNREWPPGPHDTLNDVYPAGHITDYVQRSLDNLGTDRIDLLQFHVWEDRWAADERWQEAVRDLKERGLIESFGLSVNRWEPANCLAAIDTGLVDVIQVIYNIFDQAPEDELFDRAMRDGIGIVARVPFDEGTLTGTLTAQSGWPPEDWRSTYFGPENLLPSIEHADRLKPVVPAGMTMPELALRFILTHPAVSTVIPGMRKLEHVHSNLAVSDGERLSDDLIARLRPPLGPRPGALVGVKVGVIALWAHSRSTSTAFQRMMIERGDVTTVHEPWLALTETGAATLPGAGGGTTTVTSDAGLRDHLVRLGEARPVFVKEVVDYRYPYLFDTPAEVAAFTHTFIIRDPAPTIASHYAMKPTVTSPEIGFERLAELFDALWSVTGRRPLVLRAERLIEDPVAAVGAFCDYTGLPFAPEAITWQPQDPPEWGRHRAWHLDAITSSGFTSRPNTYEVTVANSDLLRSFYDHHHPFYERMVQHAD